MSKDVYYSSTRGDKETIKASEAILRGLAPDGGLYVPSFIPQLEKSLQELSGLSYQETAYHNKHHSNPVNRRHVLMEDDHSRNHTEDKPKAR